jgi:phage/plasmid-like protein (TIGR03299 family)
MLAKLPQTFEPIAGDLITQNCVLYNSHDGSMPLSVMFTPIRVVCQNTFNLALKHCTNIVRIRHTVNASDRLAEAGRILRNMNDYFTRMGETCHKLASFNIDDKFIQEYQDEMFKKESDISDRGPGRSIRMKKLEFFKGRLRNGMGVDLPGVKGTAWWCVNAMVEMADYDLPKNNEDKTEYCVFGAGADFKQKAFDSALEMVAVRSK